MMVSLSSMSKIRILENILITPGWDISLENILQSSFSIDYEAIIKDLLQPSEELQDAMSSEPQVLTSEKMVQDAMSIEPQVLTSEEVVQVIAKELLTSEEVVQDAVSNQPQVLTSEEVVQDAMSSEPQVSTSKEVVQVIAKELLTSEEVVQDAVSSQLQVLTSEEVVEIKPQVLTSEKMDQDVISSEPQVLTPAHMVAVSQQREDHGLLHLFTENEMVEIERAIEITQMEEERRILADVSRMEIQKNKMERSILKQQAELMRLSRHIALCRLRANQQRRLRCLNNQIRLLRKK